MAEDRSWQEAKEVFGTMLRWTPEPKKPDEKTLYLGPEVQGIYSGMKTDVGQNASNVYDITLPDGRLVSIWGSDLLDGKFKEIPIGSEVLIRFLGIQQPKTPTGRAYNGFQVMYAKPVAKMAEAGVAPAGANAAPVAAAPAAAPAQGIAPGAPGWNDINKPAAPAAGATPEAGY